LRKRRLLRQDDFYSLNGALGFTREALYAFFLPCGKSLLVRFGMPRSVSPLIKLHGANLKAYSVSFADIPVYSHVGSSDAQLLRRLHWSPDCHAFLFSGLFAVFLKIRIYRQTVHLTT